MQRPAFLSDKRGVSTIEFAILSPVLFLIICGGLEIGHQLYVQSVLTGQMQKAGRDLALETSANSDARYVLEQRVKSAVKALVSDPKTTFVTRGYHDYRNVGRPEEYVDTNGNGTCDNKEPYIDANNSGTWDKDSANLTPEGARDVVLFEATVKYDRILFGAYLPFGREVTLKSSTLLRNQPSTEQAAAPQRNCG
jgi:Flp pilus assembly protein TadG